MSWAEDQKNTAAIVEAIDRVAEAVRVGRRPPLRDEDDRALARTQARTLARMCEQLEDGARERAELLAQLQAARSERAAMLQEIRELTAAVESLRS